MCVTTHSLYGVRCRVVRYRTRGRIVGGSLYGFVRSGRRLLLRLGHVDRNRSSLPGWSVLSPGSFFLLGVSGRICWNNPEVRIDTGHGSVGCSPWPAACSVVWAGVRFDRNWLCTLQTSNGNLLRSLSRRQVQCDRRRRVLTMPSWRVR